MYLKGFGPLTLEQRLKDICNSNPRYSQLYASWELDKKVFKEILATVSYNFAHFSLHDASHADSIIDKIEMVLGEERIRQLGPTDTWLLLQAAYAHDFGMVITDSEVREAWKSKEFQRYLDSAHLSSIDEHMKEAAKYILSFQSCDKVCAEVKKSVGVHDWPITVRRAAVLLTADYFRSKHADRSRSIISNGSILELDFSHNDLIMKRLINLLGKIAQMHGKDNFRDVFDLEYQDNGIGSDIIHPRFISCMLRLGDLLDLDNGRFSRIQNKVFGELPELSRAHVRKHNSVESFLISPSSIRVKANCPEEISYREMRRWCDWLVEETQNLAIHWTDIAPKELTGAPPKAEKIEVLLNGNQDGLILANLQFNLKQDDAFALLQGANIYKNKLAFVRELLQNAIDASKLRLWQDLKDGRYDYALNLTEGEELLPFHVVKDGVSVDIWKPYEIVINIEYDELLTVDDTRVRFSIKDRGIGMSQEDLKNIANAGKSWGSSKQWSASIEEMPRWLRPTGAFGIGMQSAFLVSDSLIAYTKSPKDDKGKKVTFLSRLKNGYISITSPEKEKGELKQGTEFIVDFEDFEINSINMDGYTAKALKTYDSFKDNAPVIVFQLLEEILKWCNNSLFPINIKINGEDIPFLLEREASSLDNKFEGELSSTYRYKWIYQEDKGVVKTESVPVGIEIFETKLQSFVKVYFPKGNKLDSDFRRLVAYGQTLISFKGMKVDSGSDFRYRYLDIKWDIWGLETKEYLTLNREELKLDDINKHKQLSEVLHGVCKFAIKELNIYFKGCNSELVDNKGDIEFLQIRLLFEIWLKTEGVDVKVLQKITDLISSQVMKDVVDIKNLKEVESEVEPSTLTVGEFFAEYKNIAVIIRQPSYEINEKNILKMLSANKIYPISKLIMRNFLRDLYSTYKINKLQLLDDGTCIGIIDNPLDSDNKDYTLTIDKDSRNKLFLELKKRLRGYIPPINNYSKLIVNKLPREFNSLYSNERLYLIDYGFIISPVTSKDIEKITSEKMSNETLKREIAGRLDFNNLVQWVLKNQIHTEQRFSIAEIAEQYMNLIDEIHYVFSQER